MRKDGIFIAVEYVDGISLYDHVVGSVVLPVPEAAQAGAPALTGSILNINISAGYTISQEIDMAAYVKRGGYR